MKPAVISALILYFTPLLLAPIGAIIGTIPKESRFFKSFVFSLTGFPTKPRLTFFDFKYLKQTLLSQKK